MNIQPILHTVTPTATNLFLEAFFQAMKTLSYQPLGEALAQPGHLQFEEDAREWFRLDLQLCFFQRLQWLEKDSDPNYTARSMVLPGATVDEPVHLFQYLTAAGKLIAEANIAFTFGLKDGCLTHLTQCFNYQGVHSVTLTEIITDADGNEWYPGETIAYDVVDASLREGLREKLKKVWEGR